MVEQESRLNKSLKHLARSSFVVFIAVILSKLFGYAYRIFVARSYGPEVYGLLALSLMLISWFTLLANLGLGTGILRYISFYRGKEDDDKISYITKFYLGLLFITGIISGILLFFLSDVIAEKIFSNSQLTIFLKIFSLTIPLVSLKTIFFSLMQAYEKVEWWAFTSKILNNLVKLIVLVVLFYIGIDAINIPLSYLSAAIVTILFSYIFCKINFKKIFKIKPRKNKQLIKNIFSYSWPLIFFGFSMALLHQTDSFMIGLFKTVKDVGFYNAAIPIALLLTISIDLFNHLFFPLVTKEYARGNKDLVKQLSKQVGKWVYMISLPLFVIFMIFPGVFIKLLF